MTVRPWAAWRGDRVAEIRACRSRGKRTCRCVQRRCPVAGSRSIAPPDGDAAVVADGVDPQDVAVGEGPARLARLEVVVVVAADDQVAGRCPRAVSQA